MLGGIYAKIVLKMAINPKLRQENRQTSAQTKAQSISPAFFAMLLGVFLFVGVAGFHYVFAESGTSPQDASGTAESQIDKEALAKQLEALEAEISQIEAQVSQEKSKKESLERELNILKGEISRIQLQIRQLDLAKKETDLQIKETEKTIGEAEERLLHQKELLSSIIRNISQEDKTTAIELVLQYDSFSEFFNRLESIHALEEGLSKTYTDLQNTKSELETKHEDLELKQAEQEQLRVVQGAQKKELSSRTKGQEKLVKETKGREDAFAKLAKERQKSAAEIRNQLFVLEGAGVALNFEDAYLHAKAASSLTGVRPAFLLALLQQESRWGKFTGGCTWKEEVRGKAVMNPTRDQPIFENIATALGFNPDTQKVSCPLIRNGARFGWGGAMGPAQFLPSTWAAHKDRTAELLGGEPNPFSIRDAFVAAAVKLASHGAAEGTYKEEWKAAMIYFSGSKWARWEETVYANPIMQRATGFQEEIDILNAS